MNTTYNSLLYMSKFINRCPAELQGRLAEEKYFELLNIWQKNFAPDMRVKFEQQFGELPDTQLELDRFTERYFRENELTEDNLEKYREVINEIMLEWKKDTFAQDMGYTVE